MAKQRGRSICWRAAWWGWASQPGDRIALVSENRPEWLIADHAIMAVGALTVPPYTTNTTADHAFILTHSGAKGVIVSTAALAQRLLPAAIEVGRHPLRHRHGGRSPAQRTVFRQLSWEQALARRRDAARRHRRARSPGNGAATSAA